jgi:sterol desaturase/sphingolipid hydroxylase (fatty acid hydroxylase superfamily)
VKDRAVPQLVRLARFLVTYLYYPGALAASVAAALVLLEAGIAPGVVVAANGAAFAALCFGLERVVPETPRWRHDPLELRTDVLHALVSNTLPTALFRTLFYALAVAAAARLGAVAGGPLWPVHWPLLAQLPLALVVAEGASYSIHRALHETRLWPLHAVHHSSRRLYFLLVTRKHPVQAFLTYGARLSVLWLLGVPAPVLVLYTVVTTTNGFVQHANLHMRFGPLNWIFATPELHRWHHSKVVEESNANYGDVLIVWDWLFGTRIHPQGEERLHDGLGLPDGFPVEHTYRGHLALPFVWHRRHAAPERSAPASPR